jgi:hypothetical protein
MTSTFKKITPHILIVVTILVICFFTVKPFLAINGNNNNQEIIGQNSDSQSSESQLASLMTTLFESQQLASLVSVGNGLPILEQTVDSTENFEKIKTTGNIGIVGRRNPFMSTEE